MSHVTMRPAAELPEEQVETVDLLAHLQASLDRAKAELAAAQAAKPATTGHGPKIAATKAATAARFGFRKGDRVRINTPRSPQYHGRETVITGTNPECGEAQALGVWFAPSELTKLPKTAATTK